VRRCRRTSRRATRCYVRISPSCGTRLPPPSNRPRTLSNLPALPAPLLIRACSVRLQDSARSARPQAEGVAAPQGPLAAIINVPYFGPWLPDDARAPGFAHRVRGTHAAFVGDADAACDPPKSQACPLDPKRGHSQVDPVTPKQGLSTSSGSVPPATGAPPKRLDALSALAALCMFGHPFDAIQTLAALAA
jgi:hypothetical protein